MTHMYTINAENLKDNLVTSHINISLDINSPLKNFLDFSKIELAVRSCILDCFCSKQTDFESRFFKRTGLYSKICYKTNGNNVECSIIISDEGIIIHD